MTTFKESLQMIMAYQLHDTMYDRLTGQDKLSVDQAIDAFVLLIDKNIIGEDDTCTCSPQLIGACWQCEWNELRQEQREALHA